MKIGLKMMTLTYKNEEVSKKIVDSFKKNRS